MIALGKTELGEVLQLDVDGLTHVLLTGSTGSGKSSALRLLLERSYGKMQQIVLDLEGEFTTLREGGRDYVIVGGAGSDVPAHPASARLLGRRMRELRTVSWIVDLSDVPAVDREDLVRGVLEGMLEAPRHLWSDVLLVLDEAHHWAPEAGKKKGGSASKDAVADIAARGRKRGIHLLVATQRLAKLAKDVAAECDTKLVGRTNGDDDRHRALDELAMRRHADAAGVLAKLQPGEFLAFGPALSDDVVRAKLEEPSTRPPPRGTAARAPPPAPEKVRALLEELRDLPQRAEREAQDLGEARGRIRELERDLQDARAGVPVLDASTIEETEKELAALRAGVQERDDVVARLRSSVRAARLVPRDRLDAGVAAIADTARLLREALDAPVEDLVDVVEAAPVAYVQARPRPAHASVIREAPSPPSSRARGAREGTVQQRILDALAELHALGVEDVPRALVATFAGYTHVQSKGFVNAVSAVSTAGLLEYAPGGGLRLTSAGRGKATRAARPLSDREVHERVVNVLGGTSARILTPLLRVYPRGLSRAELSKQAGYTHVQSKGFVNPLSRLHVLGFVRNDRGTEYATDRLFPTRRGR